MRRLIGLGAILFATLGCELTEPDKEEDLPDSLTVTARSATTLSLSWSSLGTPDTYAVDFLTGVSRCEDFPPHDNVLTMEGTTVTLQGLAPSTEYHIHVHLLPFDDDKATNTVLVSTLAAGAAEQSVAATDYEACFRE